MSSEISLAIAMAVLTLLLVIVTTVYAVETHRTVNEMKGQRAELGAQVDELRAQREDEPASGQSP